jgi:hypothetical protein
LEEGGNPMQSAIHPLAIHFSPPGTDASATPATSASRPCPRGSPRPPHPPHFLPAPPAPRPARAATGPPAGAARRRPPAGSPQTPKQSPERRPTAPRRVPPRAAAALLPRPPPPSPPLPRRSGRRRRPGAGGARGWGRSRGLRGPEGCCGRKAAAALRRLPARARASEVLQGLPLKGFRRPGGTRGRGPCQRLWERHGGVGGEGR